jgi:hypothetical protein
VHPAPEAGLDIVLSESRGSYGSPKEEAPYGGTGPLRFLWGEQWWGGTPITKVI